MSPRKRPSTGSIVDVHFAPSIGSESSHECHSPLQLRLFGFDRPAISGNPSSKADVAAYESLRVRAGREPAAQIQVALWCEQHGMTAEKVKHLAAAVLRDPQNAMARGLLGLLPSGGKWETPEAVNARLSTDEGKMAKLAEYNRRRDELQALSEAGFRLVAPPGKIARYLTEAPASLPRRTPGSASGASRTGFSPRRPLTSRRRSCLILTANQPGNISGTSGTTASG